VCLDHSRVDLGSYIDRDEGSFNYIHANYVDGYKQKKAFINAQGPLDETVEDFWSMIWQECTVVIAMTTKVIVFQFPKKTEGRIFKFQIF